MEVSTRNAMHSEQLNRRNLAAQGWSVVLLGFNFIGAVVYVVAASDGWVIPQEREPGGEVYCYPLTADCTFNKVRVFS